MTAPVISSARNFPFPSTIEVYFDQPMLNNAGITNTGAYSLNLGAYVTSIEKLQGDIDPVESVRLTVENLFGYPEFVLSINDGFLFSHDNPGPSESFNISSTATITIDLTDERIYALSAANGRLKSGREAKQVAQDDDYFYIRTESGVDVVDKTSLFNKGYILRSGGVNTIFISGE